LLEIPQKQKLAFGQKLIEVSRRYSLAIVCDQPNGVKFRSCGGTTTNGPSSSKARDYGGASGFGAACGLDLLIGLFSHWPRKWVSLN
jgi:hypothetical protein